MQVAVFGVFDLFHEGHKHFLKTAKSYGNHLTVYLTDDEVVAHFKGRRPEEPFAVRAKNLRESGLIDAILPGDTLNALGNYSCVLEHQPDCLVFGYDQHELHQHFTDFLTKTNLNITIHRADSFEPTIYKTQLLRKTL